MVDDRWRPEQLRVAVSRFQYRDFAIPIERKTPRLPAALGLLAAPGLPAARAPPSMLHMAALEKLQVQLRSRVVTGYPCALSSLFERADHSACHPLPIQIA
jgi:hypothetical protein